MDAPSQDGSESRPYLELQMAAGDVRRYRAERWRRAHQRDGRVAALLAMTPGKGTLVSAHLRRSNPQLRVPERTRAVKTASAF